MLLFRAKKYGPGWMGGWVGGWMDGWQSRFKDCSQQLKMTKTVFTDEKENP